MCVGGEVKMSGHDAHVSFFEGVEVGVGTLVEIGEFASEPEIIAAVLILAFFKAVGPIGMRLFAYANSIDG